MSALKTTERGLTWITWIVAGALALMLLIGPQVIAEDKPEEKASAGTPDGKTLFSESCGGCHTLEAAGTSGAVGPSLDETSLGPDEIASIVSEGRGGMPSFGGDLDEAEIDAIAEFVASANGG